jgi:hypothetical protein
VSPVGHVFGYGSLAAMAERVVSLRGRRRVWGVAMDNRVAVPGYKVYELPDGTRPPVSVAFLDLAPAGEECAVEGGLLPVDAEALAVLDTRERQYERVDVTGVIEPAAGPGPVWAYVGRAEGRARAAAGRAGTAEVVVQRAYVDLVETAFAELGDGCLARYRASTEAVPFAVVELARVDLPG